jgi:AbrB family looped-hinge helix DNA binding protein
MVRTVTIDDTGRVVIPKNIREEHHLYAGRRLTLIVDKERLVLEPVEREDELIERDGLLLVSGRILDRNIDHRLAREERIKDLVSRAGSKVAKKKR